MFVANYLRFIYFLEWANVKSANETNSKTEYPITKIFGMTFREYTFLDPYDLRDIMWLVTIGFLGIFTMATSDFTSAYFYGVRGVFLGFVQLSGSIGLFYFRKNLHSKFKFFTKNFPFLWVILSISLSFLL